MRHPGGRATIRRGIDSLIVLDLKKKKPNPNSAAFDKGCFRHLVSRYFLFMLAKRYKYRLSCYCSVTIHLHHLDPLGEARTVVQALELFCRWYVDPRRRRAERNRTMGGARAAAYKLESPIYMYLSQASLQLALNVSTSAHNNDSTHAPMRPCA